MDPPIPYYMIPGERMQNDACNSKVSLDTGVQTTPDVLDDERAVPECPKAAVLRRWLAQASKTPWRLGRGE